MTHLEEIIAQLQSVFSESEVSDEQDMAAWRKRIYAIDQLLLVLLNERSACANTIGHIKKQLNLPIYVPEREKIVLDNVLKGNKGPLDNAAVRGLFERIIDETRSLERRKYQYPDQTDPTS